jgi:3-phosphoshikimate 1-carboxyvinyltransferase
MEAPPSKSMAHRLLICAGFAEGESVIRHVDASEDILATADCLRALGAEVRIEEGTAYIRGYDPRKAGEALLACRESGSTLRFMIPAALLCGKDIRFTGSERLMSRPLTVYEALCAERGMVFVREDGGLRVRGTLTAGTYIVRGDISSQFISGLMFALPLTGADSRIEILLGQAVGIVAVEDAHADDIQPQCGAQITENGLRFHSVGRLLFDINTKNRHGLISFVIRFAPHVGHVPLYCITF